MHHPHIHNKLHIVLRFYRSSLLLNIANYIEHGAVDSEDDRNSAKCRRFRSEKTNPMSTLMVPKELLRLFNVFDMDFNGLINN